MQEAQTREVKLAVCGWFFVAAAVWIAMLAAFAVTSFYRMMGCGTARTASVGTCDPVGIAIVIDVAYGVIAAVIVLGMAAAVTCCGGLIAHHGDIRDNPALVVATWGLATVILAAVTTLAIQTPWHAIGQMGLPIFLYGTVPASIVVPSRHCC